MGSCAHRSIRMGSCAHGIGAAVRGYCTHTRSVAGSCYVTLLLVHNRALVLGVSAWCLLGVCLVSAWCLLGVQAGCGCGGCDEPGAGTRNHELEHHLPFSKWFRKISI